MCCADHEGRTTLGQVGDGELFSILTSARSQSLWEGFEAGRLRHPHCQRCLGSPNPLLAAVKGLGSLALARFARIQGENVVVLR